MIQFEEMADNQEGFCLRSADGDTQPVFAGVEAKGRLEGVLFALTLRQTYRNAGTTKLEVVYTFPLPSRGVLLGFAAELDGKRLEGRILPRRDAEQTYEEALAEGDAPVMLEVSGGGLHTANIGNLQPGEQIVLEIRTAQLLTFEQGRLRLAIPTTIAPRHGNPARAGLLPHQVPQASLEAEYPLSIELSVLGSLAEGDIDCPTHSHRRSAGEGGVVVALVPGATLDRDVVFLVTPASPRPGLLVQAADTVGARTGAGLVALAAFSLPVGRARPPARLKLLVDCSGSMMGDSMASAHRALHGVLDGLRNDDAVSFSRFGDRLDQVIPMSPVSTQLVAGLRRKIDATTASLGGTEMAAALLALIKGKDLDPQGPDDADRADILLITDGEVWDVAKVVEAARHSGHRVFAIGVGSAPAEAVLAQLAESTGGACEFATPGEALESAAVRMLTRTRQVNWSDMRVDWGVAPRWQVALPRSGYGGDTALALAGFGADQPALKTARLFASAEDGPTHELAAAEVEAPTTGDSLARIAAGRRLASLDPERGMEMALAYSLLSDHTHCILVHRRPDEDKVGEEAQLHRVSSMLAAGWSGTGTVMQASASRQVNSSISTPSVWRSVRSHSARTIDFLNQSDLDFSEQQAPPSAQAMKAVHEPSLLDIGDLVVRHFNGGGSIKELSMAFLDFKANPALRDAMRELQGLIPDESLAWLMLALWVAQRPGSDGNVHHASLLARHVGLIDPVTLKRAEEVLYRRLGAYPSDSWASARTTRLRKLIRAE